MRLDKRNINAGYEIPKENYCDQPYIVITKDGNWLCVLTTGPGLESQKGQHVVATISKDKGKTWSNLIDIESTTENMSSWVTALIVPSGRVYAIYDFDQDGESSMHGGWLCYRYSDDNGLTWSKKRYRIPMRLTKQDRENVSGGKHQYFWCIDKPVVSGGAVFFGLPKLHAGYGLIESESWVYRSDNILTESDPNKIHWELLPEGDEGIHNPALGKVQEEQNIEVLSDGSLTMCLRTEIGHPAYTISRDKGRTWTMPQVMRYPNGRPLKTPRACPRIWKADNGKFVFWFHNDAFPGWGNSANRNPVWLTGGIEKDGEIQWAQPEILLYCDDPTILGMSYPDFFEQDGHYYVSETQKMYARVHEIDPTLLEGLWKQHTKKTVAKKGLMFETKGSLAAGASMAIPQLPSLKDGGFTLDVWLKLDDITPGQLLLSSFGVKRRGFQVLTAENGALKLELHDGQARRWLEAVDGADPSRNVRSVRVWNWTTDEQVIQAGKLHHVVFIVDGLAQVVSIVVDGVLCDGGDARIQGWWRLNPGLQELNDAGLCKVGDKVAGRIEHLRLYDRYLRTSEAVGNYRAGLPKA
jgi:hypothetical protein